MFDIAWSELLVIAVVALIFIGPKELPGMLHTLGRFVRKIRNHADDFRRQFDDSMREGGYQDLQKNLQDFRDLNPAGQLKDSIRRAIDHDYSKSAPTPEQAQAVVPLASDAAKATSASDVSAAPPATSVVTAAVAPPSQTETAAVPPTPPRIDNAVNVTVPVAETVKTAVDAERKSADLAAPSSQAIPAKPLEPQAAASDPAKDRIAPAA
ncbi:Sec-independent protein translocase protein TatB [Rhodomicrobium lacus]|uniref:Sec-independent protein translocase protein TatB n=1 Tax=Rhodomicrobium lacus TaxID=2498452 RepID=UPI000F8C59DC|nr:Sec-independent protein translocase protein TatB [Rhodomicrobium lacus]